MCLTGAGWGPGPEHVAVAVPFAVAQAVVSAALAWSTSTFAVAIARLTGRLAFAMATEAPAGAAVPSLARVRRSAATVVMSCRTVARSGIKFCCRS